MLSKSTLQMPTPNLWQSSVPKKVVFASTMLASVRLGLRCHWLRNGLESG